MPRTKRRGVPSLGERIRQLMEALQLEASELSARTGISESYLSRIIRGEVPNPTIDFVIRIATGLGVTETQLLSPELRRRGSGVLASPILGELPDELESGDATTVGKDIDEVIKGLSQDDREKLRQVLVPHARQLAQLITLAKGEGNETE
jgi:transcriptional regulator with XRE-family HTH domain